MYSPVGSLVVPGLGTGTQVLSTTPAAMSWSAGAGDSNTNDGDCSIIADPTNKRILLAIGTPPKGAVYRVDFSMSFLLSANGPSDVIAQLRKNGVAVPNAYARGNATTAISANISFSALVNVTPTDNPANIATMAAPSGTFTGGSGAPDIMVPFDIALSEAGGAVTITIQSASLVATRVG